MKKFIQLSLLTLALSPALLASDLVNANSMPQSVSPANANVYIISPVDGATVKGTFTVTFGLKDMGVSPAGIEKKHTGHHHLLVDKDSLPAFDMPMGGDVQHFGGGQTQTTLTLPKGQHTLQLILGDHHHIPHKPAVVSKKITITVE
ncbi:rod shape-determining protein RodA [Colwellia psychrerythraea]|uniref:Rod shape-determining protein RodA n=1 Tax=Colwellia psychrerythraea TaxID=28229 RepID=A0A1Y5EWF9_COLPS|nr:rod shape-determining protein RodA [Colwellia psychrerythraea]